MPVLEAVHGLAVIKKRAFPRVLPHVWECGELLLQLAMQNSPDQMFLTVAETACLKALCSGACIKSRVAVKAGIDLQRANRALWQLAEKGLAEGIPNPSARRLHWQPTPRGRRAPISTVPDPKARSDAKERAAVRSGSSAQRLLQLLEQPKRLPDLAVELGLSRQRVHQIIVQLLAFGLIHTADPERPTRTVARIDDPTDLLRFDEERVLSAIPDDDVTTVKSLAKRLGLTAAKARNAISVLVAQGLVEAGARIGSAAVYRMTPEGSMHAQRDPSSRRAEPPPLPVKSDRVRSVLDYFVEKGPSRTSRVGQDLEIALRSINSLMQYLKRRSLVRKSGEAWNAPHEITSEGRRVLGEMMRRAGWSRV